MQGVDLEQFQFDYDLTWAALFLNSDGTVYGRYGARDESGAMTLNSVAGMRATVRRILEIHKGYPENRAQLQDKRGPKPRYRRPELFPVKQLRQRAVKGENIKRKDCIHCHMLHAAEWRLAVKAGKYDPKAYFRYPPPSAIGLTMDRDAAATVKAVAKGGAAEKAGLRAGDEIQVLKGQLIASIADLMWVLHHAGGGGTLKGEALRKGKSQPFTLQLKKGWRPANLSWRASMYGMPPFPRLWIEALSDTRRKKLKIPDDHLALLVKGAWGPAVTRAGVRPGDVILSYDGDHKRCTPGQFHAYVRLNHYRPRSKLKLLILRKGAKKELVVTF